MNTNHQAARQKAFNTVWHGMNAQKAPSIEYKGRCMYRGRGGRKCAVGFLIPDQDYRSDVEGFSILRLRQYYWDVSILTEVSPTFLNKLRLAHDEAEGNSTTDEEFMHMWRDKMLAIADLFKLKVPEEQFDE